METDRQDVAGDGGQPDPRIVIRCTPEYRDWLRGLADHLGCSATLAVAFALVGMAERSGYSAPPKRFNRRSSAEADVDAARRAEVHATGGVQGEPYQAAPRLDHPGNSFFRSHPEARDPYRGRRP